MCRFVLYLGQPLTLQALITEPQHSLIHQSTHARERPEPLNGDGFGVAWYVPELDRHPGVFRSTTPAWNNANLRALSRVTRSHCVLAHVRAATPPLPVTELNCHPFISDGLALMHNGFIPGFSTGIRRVISNQLSDKAWHAVHGSTDSEHLFAMLLDRIDPSIESSAERLAKALEVTLRDVLELVKSAGITRAARLNVAVSDGEVAVVSRCCPEPDKADSLYLHSGKSYVCDGGVCRMIDPDSEDDNTAIVASEPLSDDPGWDKVPVNHLVVIDKSRRASLRPLAL